MHAAAQDQRRAEEQHGYELQRVDMQRRESMPIRSNGHRIVESQAGLAEESQPLSSPVPIPVPNSPPATSYQILLVLAGALMTFHVIGINQVYGIFQVMPCVLLLSLPPYLPTCLLTGVLHVAPEQHPRRSRPRRARLISGFYSNWADMGRVYLR